MVGERNNVRNHQKNLIKSVAIKIIFNHKIISFAKKLINLKSTTPKQGGSNMLKDNWIFESRVRQISYYFEISDTIINYITMNNSDITTKSEKSMN